MNKSFKTEIKPTKLQIDIIEDNIRLARHAFNLYIKVNCARLARGAAPLPEKSFYKSFTTDYLLRAENAFRFPKSYNRNAVRHVIINAENAIKNYVEGKISRPCAKKAERDNIKLFYPNSRYREHCIECNGRALRLEGLGYVKLKEKDYFPKHESCRIVAVYISKRAGRYYASMTADVDEEKRLSGPAGESLELTVGKICNRRISVLERRLKRQEKSLARKRISASVSGRKGGGNIRKIHCEIARTRAALLDAKRDSIRKSVSYVVRLCPDSIVLREDAVDFSDYGAYKKDLQIKCRQNHIKLKSL